MRSRLGYYREKFDPKRYLFEEPWESFETIASDGVQIRGSQLKGDGDRVFVVAHGLFAHHRAPGFAEAADSLRRYGDVVSFDFRGHGSSQGRCTLGNFEALDVAAVVGSIRETTSKPMILIGFSMGAAASVRAAALHVDVSRVVSVSGPAGWFRHRRWGTRRTALVWEVPGISRISEELTGVRLAQPWQPSAEPSAIASRVAPAALLVVHGSSDPFFTEEAAVEIYEAARDPRQLWLIPRGGHAEGLFIEPGKPVDQRRVDAFVDALVERLEMFDAPSQPSEGSL